MRTLIYALVFCLMPFTSAFAQHDIVLGDTFDMTIQDECQINKDKQVECKVGDKLVALFSFNGVVAKSEFFTQENLASSENNDKLAATIVEAMKKDIKTHMEAIKSVPAPGWESGPVVKVVHGHDMWFVYGGMLDSEGVLLTKLQIWYNGEVYEMNTAIEYSDQNFQAYLDSVLSIRETTPSQGA